MKQQAHTSSKQVEFWVSSKNPEPVVFPPKRLQAGPLGHVPDADRLVLRVRENELLARVEEDARHVVVVTAASVDFPGLGFCERRGKGKD